MTIVNIKCVGNKVTSSIDGFGVEELRKVVEKMDDGFSWHLEVYSTNTAQQGAQVANGGLCLDCGHSVEIKQVAGCLNHPVRR